MNDTRTIHFVVRDVAHGVHVCTACGRKLAAGEAAVSVVAPGTCHTTHDGACPTHNPNPNPENRVIQGST